MAPIPERISGLAEALRKALNRRPHQPTGADVDAALADRRRESEQHLRDLQDVNSQFPATQEFLKARGLTNVRQLDAKGKADLIEHLHAVFQSVGD